MANDRISQLPVEALVSPDSGKARTSQEPVEALVSPTSAKARVSQEPVEALVSPTSGKARTSQLVVEALIEVSLGQGVDLGLIDQTAVTFTPTAALAQSVDVALVDQTVVAFAPTTSSTADISPALINQTAAGFAPTISTGSVDISLGLVSQAAAAFTPVVTAGQIVSLTLIDQTAATFAPVVIVAQFVDLGLIDQTVATFAPVTSSGAQDVSLDLLDAAAATFAPTVASGAVSISLALLSAPATTYAPVLVYNQDLTISLVNQAARAFRPAALLDAVGGPGGGGAGGVGAPPIIELLYGGDDGVDIMPDVVIADARFISQVNGVSGECRFRVKDPLGTYSFTVGKELVLKFNGENLWRGYVARAQRGFAFDAQNTFDSTTRFFIIDGFDINILFRKRVVFNQTKPLDLTGPVYKANNTPDTTALTRLFNNFLDLSSDDLNTTQLIENVGYINIDHQAVPIQPAETWDNTMKTITSLTNAIFYIDPDKKVVHTDVDTPNAALALSDVPASGGAGGGGGTTTDPFDRTVAANSIGWGAGALGTWYWEDHGATWEVDGSVASLSYLFGYQQIDSIIPSLVDGDWTFSLRLKWPTINSQDTEVEFFFGDPPYSGDYGVGATIAYEYSQIGEPLALTLWWYTPIADDEIRVELATGFVPSGWATLELGLNSTTGLVSGRYYADGDPAPAWTTLAGSITSAGVTNNPMLGLSLAGGFGNVWEFDDVSVSVEAGAPALESIGYREMDLVYDGTNLVNDALIWGIALGGSNVVIAREQDAASITAHGRWQMGELNGSMYKQATVNRRASSIVDGSPLSKRGAKDDRVSVAVTVFQDGFRVAEKVDFTSEVYDFNDVIPIRRMEISFVSPTALRYRLFLSHEIDMPWNFFDNYFYRFNIPDIRVPPWPEIPSIDDPGGCDDAVCGITDSFDRSVSPSHSTAGQSDAGPTWTVTNYFDPTDFVEVTSGQMNIGVTNRLAITLPGAPANMPWTVSWGMRFNDAQDTARVLMNFAGQELRIFRDFTSPASANIFVNAAGFADPFTQGVWYHFRLSHFVFGGDPVLALQWWAYGDPDPGAPSGGEIITQTFGTTSLDIEVREFDEPSASVSFRDLDIAGFTRCDQAQFDDFNRVVVDDLGSSLDGGEWTMSGSGTANRGVDGSSAYVTGSAFTAWVPGALWDLDPFTLVTRVKLGTNTDQSSVRFAISDDLFDYAEVFLDGSGNFTVDDNVDFNEDTVDDASLSTSSWYLLKWQLAGSVSRAKYWIEGSTEPDWLVETALPNLGGRAYLIMALAATTGTTLVDDIDFDYDGKPCYQDCASGETVNIDLFSRSVGSGWGVASSGGTWAKTATFGTTVESVGGTKGTSENPGGSTASTVMKLPLPDVFADRDWAEFRILVDTTIQNQVIGIYDSAESAGIDAYLSTTGGPKVQFGYTQSSTHFWDVSSFTYPTNGSPFWVALRLEGSDVYFKGWLASGSEPASWEGPKAGADLTVATMAKVYYQNGQSASAGQLSIDEIVTTLPGCVPVSPGTGAPNSGPYCEVLPNSVGGTEFATSKAWYPGTLKVYINGALRTAYTSNPALGEISLTASITSSDVIYVCYQANGDPA